MLYGVQSTSEVMERQSTQKGAVYHRPLMRNPPDYCEVDPRRKCNMTGHLGWGHFDDAVQQFEFAYFMFAWVVSAINAQQELRKYNRKRKEREQWNITR